MCNCAVAFGVAVFTGQHGLYFMKHKYYRTFAPESGPTLQKNNMDMSKRCDYLAKQPDDPMHMSYRQLDDIYSEKVEVFPQRRSRSSEVFKHIAKRIPTKTGLKLCDPTWSCHS